ncbi:hypothetical protein [Faecalibaculum rodentium]|uniref:hypothetical protein n=1 Tax=Faecalibaculum rodentium TaxID=1702221 RepID=UPI003F681241
MNWVSKLFDQIVYNKRASLAVKRDGALCHLHFGEFEDLSAMSFKLQPDNN